MATTTGACRVTMECGDCEHQYEDHLTRREVERLRVDPHDISDESRCPRCAQCESSLIRIHSR